MSIFYATDKNTLIFSMLGVGIAWASILSMPYAILAGALPENKMGIYMGIFNFFIVIPQITAAAILGYIVKTVFNNEPIYALVIGGASMFVAAALVMIVQDHEKGNKETLSYK
jgi:maltose/moltooligosaccharide transporter